jgi:predicted DNA-binding protein
MSKQDQYFRKIAEYKERLRNLSTETLKGRLGSSFLYKEAAIAIRELIEEREQQLLEGNSTERIYLIQRLSELHGTCYFEILPGKYEGKCWNQNSVFLTEEVFGYLEPVFERNELDFDHYAFTEIQKEVWICIISDLCRLIEILEQAQDIHELEDKLGFIFKDSMARFVSNFRSNISALIDLLRKLVQWLENQLQSYDHISVLGI